MSRRKKQIKTSTLPQVDPYVARETEKYQKPIPSREYIIMALAECGKPLSLSEIAELLQLTTEEDLEALRRRLKAMERDGQAIRNRRKEYGLAKKMDLVRGRVIAHPDGYGFVVPDEDKEKGDVFLSEQHMRSLMHNDRVLVNIIGLDYRGRREGTLVEILSRGTQQIVGKYSVKQGIAFIEPDNRRFTQRVLVSRNPDIAVESGQMVVVEITEYPTQEEPAFGKVIEVLGARQTAGMEVDIAIHTYGLPNHWSEEILQEINQLDETVLDSAVAGRQDLRALSFVTIDGEDARDFDDAVYCEPRGRGWLLRVAIADVAHYVKKNTALDVEAKNRGNSVYFANRVIPMLPEVLSNGLCSLKPQVNRLCLVCEMAIDVYGRTRRTTFYPAMIRSAARLTYTEVAQQLETETNNFAYPDLIPHLQNLYALYQLLHKRRKKRGAIEFETVETKVLFNEQGKVQKIVGVVRNEAHKLIEEMMLAANVATAEWLQAHEIPTLYRIHEGPTPEKLTDVRAFLNRLALQLAGRKTPEAKHYAKLLETVKDRPDARLIQTVLLRSLKLAIYAVKNTGHFGLAYPAYLHFTSPIRRYPDLMVHRAIYHVLANKTPEQFPYGVDEMQLLAENCSMTERRADEATREVMSRLKCEFMKNKIGKTYPGLVTAVTSFGLFVELEGVFVEGLVHVTALWNDYYHFDPIGHRLCGEMTGMVYRLADKVHVKVMRVNVEEKKIDLEIDLEPM